MLPIKIHEDASAVGISPAALLRIGSPSWNYFQIYRVTVAGQSWHGKIDECAQPGCLHVSAAIVEALQIEESGSARLTLSSADPVKEVEYELVEDTQSPFRICGGIEIREGQICLFRRKTIRIIRGSGYVTPDTVWKQLGGEQEAGSQPVTTLAQNATSEKAGLSRIVGLQQVKQKIRQYLLLPIQQPEIASQFEVVPPNSILLDGADGVGKKLLARAIGQELGWETCWIRTADLLAPAILEEKFKTASNGKGKQLIVIEGINHLDRSVLPDRRSLALIEQFLECTKDNTDILTVGLAEDQLQLEQHNKIRKRFELKIPLPKPNRTQRAELFKEFLSPVASDDAEINYLALADRSEGFTQEDIQGIARQVKMRALIGAKTGNSDTKITTPVILNILADSNISKQQLNNNFITKYID